MTLAIKTEGLTKTYKGKKGQKIRALNNLNLSISQGTTFGFIGPNGAGKTTTIKILIGLIFPTSGHAQLFLRPASLPESRRSIGYLSEVSSYSPYLEAEELLSSIGRILGMPRPEREKKSLELLELVGLQDRKKSRLGEFSKGMLQRFGIAQSLLHDPKLLILDEPTSGLDPIAQREVLDVLRRLKERGITIFFSSHRLVEVEGLCDDVGIVSSGNLIFYGTLSQLEAQEHHTPFLIIFESKHGASPLRIAGTDSKPIEGDLHEVVVEQSNLNQALNDLHSRNLKVSSILPRQSPLEDIFIRMVTQHQGGNSRS